MYPSQRILLSLVDLTMSITPLLRRKFDFQYSYGQKLQAIYSLPPSLPSPRNGDLLRGPSTPYPATVELKKVLGPLRR